jgi:hypothetical protein
MKPKPKTNTRVWNWCPECKKNIDCRTSNGLINHLNKYCKENEVNKLKKSRGSSSSSSSLGLDMEYESVHSQANQFSFGTVLDSRGIEIVPVNQEETRLFEDYVNQEVFRDNPDIQPNNFIFASAINETNEEGDEIQLQPSRVMYGISLITTLEAEWVFNDVEKPDEKLLEQPFLEAL